MKRSKVIISIISMVVILCVVGFITLSVKLKDEINFFAEEEFTSEESTNEESTNEESTNEESSSEETSEEVSSEEGTSETNTSESTSESTSEVEESSEDTKEGNKNVDKKRKGVSKLSEEQDVKVLGLYNVVNDNIQDEIAKVGETGKINLPSKNFAIGFVSDSIQDKTISFKNESNSITITNTIQRNSNTYFVLPSDTSGKIMNVKIYIDGVECEGISLSLKYGYDNYEDLCNNFIKNHIRVEGNIKESGNKLYVSNDVTVRLVNIELLNTISGISYSFPEIGGFTPSDGMSLFSSSNKFVSEVPFPHYVDEGSFQVTLTNTIDGNENKICVFGDNIEEVYFDTSTPVINRFKINGTSSTSRLSIHISDCFLDTSSSYILEEKSGTRKLLKDLSSHYRMGEDTDYVEEVNLKDFILDNGFTGDNKGNYKFTIHAQDITGKSPQDESIELSGIDFEAPVVSNISLNSDSNKTFYRESSPLVFTSDENAIISFNVEEKISTISAIDIVVMNSDGTQHSESIYSVYSKDEKDPKNVFDGNIAVKDFASSSGTVYGILVKDTNDNTKVYELSFNGGYRVLYYGQVAPTISITAKEREGSNSPITIGDKVWFNDDFDISVSVKNHQLGYTVRGNDKTLYEMTKEDSAGIGYPDSDFNITFNTKDKITPNSNTGEVKINVSSTSIYSVKGEKEELYYIDKDSPEQISGRLNKSYKEKEGELFFSENPTLSIQAQDKLSGVKSIFVYKDNKEYSKIEGNSGNVVLKESGKYTINALDMLGNITSVELKDIIEGVSTSTIVIDTEVPIISVKRPSGGTTNGWFAGDIEYNASLSDNIGINKGYIEINGTIVSEINIAENKKLEGNIKGSTSQVQSNKDGSYNIHIYLEDNAGLFSDYRDTIYIDRNKPVIDKFVFFGDGFQEGKFNGTTGDYGFYFKDGAKCTIQASDGDITSGLSKVIITLTENGKDKTEEKSISDGSASFSIPKDFKGYISVYVTDNVGNESNKNTPDGFISETSNTAVNSIDIDIDLPETNYKDNKGLNLYNKSISITSTIKSSISGIRSVVWGIGDETRGTLNVSNNGNLSGDTGSIVSKDENLVIDLSKTIKVEDNSNNLNLWVSVVDRVGFESKANKHFSIDKDNPIISVSYNQTNPDSFYSESRVATISIKERNFDSKKVNLIGNLGAESGWSNNGESWIKTVTFSSDGDYNYSISCTDLAGNTSNIYTESKFTIDKTVPSVDVSWSNNDVKNGKYYKDARTATITVKEHNFNSSLISVEGGSVGGWSNIGDVHTANVTYNTSGTYKLSVSGKDNAGNTMQNYSSEEFIIDLDAPKLVVEGIQKGVSYKDNILVKVSVSDDAVDTNLSSVKLTGIRNKEISLSGSLSSNGGVLLLDNLPKDEKNDDVYTLSASISDMAGNEVKEEIQFSVNRFGSNYEFITENMLGEYLNKSKDVVIREYNVNEVDLNKSEVAVLFNGDKIDVMKDNVKINPLGTDSGKYVYEYNISKDVFKQDGKYMVQIFSSNVDGTNYSSASEEYSFVLDTTAPKIIISGIKSDTSYQDVEKKITVDTRDISGIVSIVAKLNGKEVTLDEEVGMFSLIIKENSKKQNFVVYAKDLAGNESEESIDNFLLTTNKLLYLTQQSSFLWIVIAIIVVIIIVTLIVVYVNVFKKENKDKSVESDE